MKIGDKVEWTCKPKGCDYCEPFVCKGIITGFKMSTFGGCKKGKGASLKVLSKKYHNHYYGKKTAFVSVKNLQLA